MYEPVIGLEIHSQLKTKTKMFCDTQNNPDEAPPNTCICPVCMGHPGTLPVPNKIAIEKVVQVGLALSCTIAKYSKFDRKNYFYPDLPKGYQISQFDMPFCEKGHLDIRDKKIRVTRVHLEEDTGKLTHTKLGSSFVDFNRAGVPLMELVTEPDITNAKEAVEFAKKLQTILRYLDASDANMEKGQMRCEVNISLRKKGEEFGTKVEIKNLNSFTAVSGSIAYEIKRQSELLSKGEKIIQETRGWDENKKATIAQRLKESAHDYRYFPEPNIPAMELGRVEGMSDEEIIDVEKIKASLPELPDEKCVRFQNEFGVSEKDAQMLVVTKQNASFFEQVVSELDEWVNNIKIEQKDIKDQRKKVITLAVNYLQTDLKSLLNEVHADISNIKITPENFAELMVLLYQKKITSAVGKVVLAEMFQTAKDPSNIIEEKGLAKVSDEAELEKIITGIITANENVVIDYKKGKQNALQFLVGQLMKETRGKADPNIGRDIFEKLLL